MQGTHKKYSAFGGSSGIRGLNALKAAIQRPYATSDGKDLYPTIYDKAAALVESLVKNHAFIDGNKRIGYVMLRIFLIESGYDLSASQTEKYSFIIEISKGNLDFEGIKDGYKDGHLQPRSAQPGRINYTKIL